MIDDTATPISFDLSEHADALAEMQEVQAEIDAEATTQGEPIADALALLALVRLVHARRVSEMRKADDALTRALNRAVDAREQCERAGALVLDAMRLLSIRRGGDPRDVDHALSLARPAL